MSDTPERGAAPARIAIIGSGPSGCYAAQALRKAWSDAEIAVIDALPVPYGLVRYGIAADHQGNKAVTKQFDRLFERQDVHFLGGVEVGVDISYSDVAAAFDIVILATGMEADRPWDLAGGDDPRILGAGTVMRLLNGDPTTVRQDLQPWGERVAVIGHGNVALDVVRMAVNPPDRFQGSDVDDDVLARIRQTPIRRVDVIGRSPAAQAKFDPAVLKELSRIPEVTLTAHGLSGDDTITDWFAARPPASTADRVEVCFWFSTRPTSIAHQVDHSLLHLDGPAGSSSISVTTVITAIGFTHRNDRPDQRDVEHLPHVFTTGWRRRGAIGSVAANRRCAQEVAAAVVDGVISGRLPTGAPGLTALELPGAHRVVDFAGWRSIDHHELSTARPGRVRTKVTSLEQLHVIAGRT